MRSKEATEKWVEGVGYIGQWATLTEPILRLCNVYDELRWDLAQVNALRAENTRLQKVLETFARWKRIYEKPFDQVEDEEALIARYQAEDDLEEAAWKALEKYQEVIR